MPVNDDLISRSALLEDIRQTIEASGCVNHEGEMLDCIRYAPAVDAEKVFEQMGLVKEAMDMAKANLVPVVRCKDCKHYELGVCLKIYSDGAVSQYAWQERKPDDFCSYGERRADRE